MANINTTIFGLKKRGNMNTNILELTKRANTNMNIWTGICKYEYKYLPPTAGGVEVEEGGDLSVIYLFPKL